MDTQYFKSKYGYEINGFWYPKVTTICSTIAKPGLLRYYANQENFAAAQENLTRASDWGKDLHEIMERILKGEKIKISPVISPSISALEDWRRRYTVSVLDTEKRVMSKDHFYAGTLDVLAEINGKLGILDLKTSTGIWDEHSLLQDQARTHPRRTQTLWNLGFHLLSRKLKFARSQFWGVFL